MARNTEQKIIDAFLNIANSEKTEFSNITVKMIAQKAHITSPTFYNHFNSIAHLIEVIREDAAKPLLEILETYKEVGEQSPFEIIAKEILPILYQNRTRIRIICIAPADFNWHLFLENRYTEWFLPYCKGIREIDFSEEWLARFFAKTIVTITTLWLADPIPEPPKLFQGKFLALMDTHSKIISGQRAS
ncbi:TetR/AcrR family transcriptional regulator [Neobacillus massiliamazoniensis]|uniref:HTH tetR-type domain-containing protein n=1 Tax=Neobacillus massiliamazoniensis TaxID=1499688 RepID=A0A0U1NQS6_9BACI|nr:TetR/AcrR family transcriptional regulator [Neobacillus massiliamazoniensis]CRK80396.1 hypothetical protein BN000_00279 [Neobacillus massiliamazoniensis]